MCTSLKISLMVLILRYAFSNAYNKARLINLAVKDNPQLKTYYGYHEDTFLEFTERTAKYGYESEKHTVTTEDRYILTIFRFLKRPHCKQLKQPPVILQHGLAVNSMNWLDPGPKSGLAYLLADECYDLWLPNARGTEYSRNHTTLDPDKHPEFWQFSHHEIGVYDYPAIIDYILNKTSNVKVNHLSHSQGAAALLIMGSLRPDYLNKIHVAIGMAPASWLSHTKSDFQLLASNWRLLYSIFDGMGIQELLHKHSIVQEVLQFICHSRSYNRICSFLVSNFDGPNKGSIDAETLTLIFAHVPDGISSKNIVHLAQIISSRSFKQYDYETENMKHYGNTTAPEYILSEINIPIALIYSDNDMIVNYKDVKTLHKSLKSAPELYRIPYRQWNHMDYIWSKDIPIFLFPKVNQILINYSYKDNVH